MCMNCNSQKTDSLLFQACANHLDIECDALHMTAIVHPQVQSVGRSEGITLHNHTHHNSRACYPNSAIVMPSGFRQALYLLSQWLLGFDLLSKILLLVLRCNQFPFEVVASGALN